MDDRVLPLTWQRAYTAGAYILLHIPNVRDIGPKYMVGGTKCRFQSSLRVRALKAKEPSRGAPNREL